MSYNHATSINIEINLGIDPIIATMHHSFYRPDDGNLPDRELRLEALDIYVDQHGPFNPQYSFCTRAEGVTTFVKVATQEDVLRFFAFDEPDYIADQDEYTNSKSNLVKDMSNLIGITLLGGFVYDQLTHAKLAMLYP